MTNEELQVEISKLQERLSAAVIFEVAPGITIGVSAYDNLWRIRSDNDALFLDKQNIWYLVPQKIDKDFLNATGYVSAEEAFDAYEEYTLNNPYFQPPITNINYLSNKQNN